MSSKLIILLLMFPFSFILVNGQVNSKERRITVFIQEDSLPKRQFGYEKYNKANNIIERARFSQLDNSIDYIEKFYYDSLNRITFYIETWFSPNKLPYTCSKSYNFNKSGLKSSIIYTSGNDTVITSYNYNKSGRLESSKTIALETNKFKYNWTGNRFFEYNSKDSCIKVSAFNLSDNKMSFHDSIIYTDSSKTIFNHNNSNNLSGKTEFIYSNGQLKKQLFYHSPILTTTKELFLFCEYIYKYNQGVLISKTVSAPKSISWCGVEDPEKKTVYTYVID